MDREPNDFSNSSAEKTVKAIRRAIRRQYAAEEKIRIVLEGLRGEESIAELCRREQINQNLYYRWLKEFPEAGKKRLAGDAQREATSDEVKALRTQAQLGISRSTFYGWYRRFAEGGVEALADLPPRPQRTWNRIPPERASAIVDMPPVEKEGEYYRKLEAMCSVFPRPCTCAWPSAPRVKA